MAALPGVRDGIVPAGWLACDARGRLNGPYCP